jgi:hypothetical protein
VLASDFYGVVIKIVEFLADKVGKSDSNWRRISVPESPPAGLIIGLGNSNILWDKQL